MGFSRQHHRSELTFPPPEVLPDPGIEPKSPASPALKADSLPTESPRNPLLLCIVILFIFENLILKLQLKTLIYLLLKIIVIYSATICNFVLYFSSLL